MNSLCPAIMLRPKTVVLFPDCLSLPTTESTESERLLMQARVSLGTGTMRGYE